MHIPDILSLLHCRYDMFRVDPFQTKEVFSEEWRKPFFSITLAHWPGFRSIQENWENMRVDDLEFIFSSLFFLFPNVAQIVHCIRCFAFSVLYVRPIVLEQDKPGGFCIGVFDSLFQSKGLLFFLFKALFLTPRIIIFSLFLNVFHFTFRFAFVTLLKSRKNLHKRVNHTVVK